MTEQSQNGISPKDVGSTQPQTGAYTAPDELTLIMFGLMRLAGASAAQRKVKRYSMIRFLLWCAVLLVLFLCFFLAYRASDHSFEQLLFVTLFGGVATFAIAPGYLKIASKWPLRFPILATFIAGLIALAAYSSDGLWQHMFIELFVAITLVICLDQLFKGTIRQLEGKQRVYSESVKAWMTLTWPDLEKAALHKARRSTTP